MIDTQLLNDVPATIGFVVALVVATSIRVVAAAALQQRKAHVDAIEQHLADTAEQSRRLRGEASRRKTAPPRPASPANSPPGSNNASHHGQQHAGPRQPRGQDGPARIQTASEHQPSGPGATPGNQHPWTNPRPPATTGGAGNQENQKRPIGALAAARSFSAVRVADSAIKTFALWNTGRAA